MGRREADRVAPRLERREAEFRPDDFGWPFERRPLELRLVEFRRQTGNARRQFGPFRVGRKVASRIHDVRLWQKHCANTFVEACGRWHWSDSFQRILGADMKRSRLVERVGESNRQAADAWERWASHRAQVMAVLRQVPADAQRLCILGAGHLHDVVLSDLVARYREISLIDVDDRTVTATLDRADARAREVCRILPATDLTGVLGLLEEVSAGDVDATRVITVLITVLGDHMVDVPGSPFDVTISLGVLTQLLQSVVDAGFPTDEVPRVLLALRDKHLRDLVRLTSPGGTCVLVTDVVSTLTAPHLLRTAESDLESAMARVVAAKNFFTGVNPYRIVALLEGDAAYAADVCDVRLCDPWLWAITPDRQHLTCAILATRRRV